MKCLTAAAILFAASLLSYSQDHAKQIYDTERAFERAVAEKGINAGFIERASFLVCVVLFLYGFFNNLIDSAWYWMALAAVTTSLVVSPLQSRVNPRLRRFPPPRSIGNEMPQGQR